MQAAVGTATVIRFGDFELDLKNRELRCSQTPVELQPQAFEILALLAARPGTLVTRAEIQEMVWPTEPSSDIYARLNFQIKSIRQALRDDAENPRYVQTVLKRGYRFIAEVEVPQATAEPNGEAVVASRGIANGRRRAVVLLSGIAAALLVAAGFVAAKSWKVGGDITKATFNGSILQAWGERDRLLWSYNFNRPLRDKEPPPGEAQIVDFGRRGKEVLVLTPFYMTGQPNPASDVLFSFSSTGNLMWRYDFDQVLNFGGKDYGGPWFLGALLATRSSAGQSSVWCAAREALWSPSALVQLDPDGHLMGQFVNWGHILTLARVQVGSGFYILAGGINNECDCAMLAVLKEDDPSGTSPPVENSLLSCNNCPRGRPYRYLLFPRSEVSWPSHSTYNQLRVIVSDQGKIHVATAETITNPPQPLGPDWKMYELSDDFIPLSVSISDHWWVLHRELESAGKIKHDIHHCPELLRPYVQVWDTATGWRNITLPAVAAP